MTDREAYPAAWITLVVLTMAFLLWRFLLGEPTVSRCWLWEHWRVYCPGCGGTRALIALAHGYLGLALWYHPPVVVTLGNVALKALAGKGYTIGEAHGKLLAAEDMRIFPLYHPASVLYNPRLKEVYEQDLRALRALQDGN